MTDETPPLERIASLPLVGIDGEGHRHHFYQYRDTVYVVDPDGNTLDHVEELEPGALEAWIDYVEERRGWTDCRYVSEGGFGALARELAARLDGRA